jgi:hypothetical protein
MLSAHQEEFNIYVGFGTVSFSNKRVIEMWATTKYKPSVAMRLKSAREG